MKMHRLDHVNIRTSNLQKMIDWYDRILGLKTGWRPDFGFPGAWIYIGDQAIIHLVQVAQECASVEPKIEHFAIQATGYKEFAGRLKDNDIAHTVDSVPGAPIFQVNLKDFDGNHIHIDFDVSESGG